MNKSLPSCSHLTADHSTLLDIKQLNTKYICAKCQYNGPNLWICLHRSCLQIGCSEQVKDHSTEHFERNVDRQLHCIHLNLSSQRAWCYICEREVTLCGVSRATQVGEPPSTHYSGDEDSDFELSHGMGTGLVGLQNIANTCYMNSALQALSNVLPMTHYFLNCGDLVDHILEQGPARYKTGLAKSYQRLICDIWRKRNDGKEYIAPRSILYGIRSVHPMFRGFQQHDTQEFLRCLMDQLHEELKEHIYRSAKQRPVKANASVPDSTNEEDTTSEMSSTSSNTGDLDFVTCESSASEQSSLCDEACTTSSPPSTLTNHHTAHGQSTASCPTGPTTTRSIISDIFDGKLLSSVQCLTCDRISTREETFQDLSLPIPDRDFLTVLHQANSISMQSLNSIDSTTSTTRVNESWLSWFWNLLRSWLWGPSVTLHDCMASFFSADELKGDNMYSCEKCNKLRTGVKYSKVLHLPEVLCIHLKRFRHDLSYSSKISSHVEFPLELFDMRPYLHKDCKSQVPLYNLSSVICHYGTVGGGHYTCFARNALLDRWYEFDDHHITEVNADTVQKCQAYVLFYNKYNPQMELLRFEASELAASYPVAQADIRFYISRDWLVRFNTFAEPGPINNWAILCPHGGIMQSKVSVIGQLAVPLPQQLWEFLQNKFGGGPAINMLFECEICKRMTETLTRRQCYEHAVFIRYSGLDAELDSGAIYAISMNWLRKWQQFARGVTHKEPGPINNTNIVAPNCDVMTKFSPLRSIRSGSDYAQLNAPLWRFLFGIYGGGPEILLRPSLTEEIEIVDQDELEEADTTLTTVLNLSDTESNLDHSYRVTETKEQQKEQSLGNAVEIIKQNGEERISFEMPKIKMSSEKRSEKLKRSIKTKTLSNNIRKKIKTKRSDIRHADLFGAKGNYITNGQQENNNKHSLLPDIKCNNKAFNELHSMSDKNYNSATTTTSLYKQCTNILKQQQQQLQKQENGITLQQDKEEEEEEEDHTPIHKMKHFNNKSELTKNSVILKKYQKILESTESNA